MINYIRLNQKARDYFEKISNHCLHSSVFFVNSIFSLIVHACSTNTTKSGELHDNETKNESNDNDSVHIYFMDSPIRMSHEEIGKKRFGTSYANPTDSGSFLSGYSEYLEFYNDYTYDPYSDPTRGGGHGTDGWNNYK